jgi:beta-lactamase regulating signal transducer with metallopeptidase domain
LGSLIDIRWLSLLEEYAIKSTLALSAALLIAALLRKRPASIRHFVLSLCLVGLLFLPMLSTLPAGWEMSFLPARPAAGPDPTAPPFPKVMLESGLSPAGVGFEVEKTKSAPSGPAENFVRASKSDGVAPTGPHWGVIALAVWAAGLTFFLLRLALGLWGARRLTKEGEDVGGSTWKILLERFLAAIGLKRKVRLKCHPEVAVPLTWGLFKPVVLIPADHDIWTEDQRSSALFHELSHIKRADFLAMILVRLSLAAFWFNPLSWFVFGQIKKEQEKACDDLVLKTGLKPSIYAANLLRFKSAAGYRWNPSTALLGLFHTSFFNERLSAILRQRLTFKEVKMKTRIILSFAVILMVAFIGTARPVSDPSEKGAEPAGLIAVAANDETRPAAYEALQVKASEQATQAEAQEKQEQQKEQEKKKEEEKKVVVKPTIVLKKKDGQPGALEITIIKGDETKTITFDKTVTIKKDADGNIIILTPEGKTLELVKGDPVRIEIKGGNLEIAKEGRTLILGEGGTAPVIITKEKIGTDIHVLTKPEIVVEKVVMPDIEKKVVVIGGKIANSERMWIAEDGLVQIREKTRQIRETIKKVKEEKLDFAELEKAISELEAELEKSKSASRIAVKIGEKPAVYSVIREREARELKGEVRAAREPRTNALTVLTEKEGTSFVVCVYPAGSGENSRDAYKRTIERMKMELPEGYSLEPEFKEEEGVVALKIKGAGTKEIPRDLLQKLVKILKEELKKDETKKDS